MFFFAGSADLDDMPKNKAALLCQTVLMESSWAYGLEIEDGRIEDP